MCSYLVANKYVDFRGVIYLKTNALLLYVPLSKEILKNTQFHF